MARKGKSPMDAAFDRWRDPSWSRCGTCGQEVRREFHRGDHAADCSVADAMAARTPPHS